MSLNASKGMLGATLLFMLAACGGGGSSGDGAGAGGSSGGDPGPTVISVENYVDVAALAYVAAARVEFVVDLLDAVFETVIDTDDMPGTYPCAYSGTMSYSKSGSNYTFSASNCDTLVAGYRVLISSGSMRVENPVATMSSGNYFLTSAAATFSNATIHEAGATSVLSGNVNMAATILSPTTSSVRGLGNLNVRRHGRTDSYNNIDLSLLATLSRGNVITDGSLTMESPRAPASLIMAATTSSPIVSLTATANDNSRVTLSTSDSANFSIDVVSGGVMQDAMVSAIDSPPLSDAIARALQ